MYDSNNIIFNGLPGDDDFSFQFIENNEILTSCILFEAESVLEMMESKVRDARWKCGHL